MFRRFKGLFVLLAILCVTAIAGGSAYFYFGGQVEKEETIDNSSDSGNESGGIAADNIFENYAFGNKTDLNETYTYYFFPSTLYMELYKNGQNPETVFGYNEVVLDDSGDPAFTSDGQPMYNIVTENSVGKDGYSTYYDYLVNSLNKDPSYYLYGDVIQTSDYSTGERYYYGNGIRGNDNRYMGFLDTLADPYIINNKDAYNALLYNQYVGNESYFTSSTEKFGSERDAYDLTTFVYQNGKIVNDNVVDKFAFSKSEEYLSPIYDNENFGISRELTDGYKKNANMFASFYQKKNSNQSRLDSVSISDVSIDYDYGPAGLHNWGEFDADELTNRTLSTYLNDFGKTNLDYIDFDLNSQNYIGAWSSPTQNTNLSLVLLNSSQGYVVDNSDYTSYYFEYSVDDDGRCEFNYGRRSNRVSGKFTITQGDPYGQMMQKAQYRNDRFGFWAPFYDWNDPKNNTAGKTEYSASRYLPIKITVNGNLTPDDMAKIIPSVESSMFDNHLYFDFTANGWTYVKKSGSELKDSELEYQSAVGGFTAKDLNYIFDIMQNPSKYASVENGENVIRLFPVFSNGKNYKDNPGETVSAANGAGDALRANFLYTDDAKSTIKNDALVSETKLNYDSLEYSYTYTNETQEIEVHVENLDEGSAFSGTLSEYTPAEGDSSETTPEIFYGTWTGVLEGMNPIDKVTIVINEDETGYYNDRSFRYTVEGNKISGTTYDRTYRITIIYIPRTVNYKVNYGVLKTVELKKGKYEQISFNIEPASEASANWQGNWIQTHVLTGNAIDSFISRYGEGLYTFYYIIGNRMKSNDLGSSLSSIGWNSNLISFLTNNTDPKNNLRNKTLLTINQAEGASKINVNQGDSYKFAFNDKATIINPRSRPVVLAVEKVTNLRLVTDIPIKEDDSGKPTGEQDWDAIDKNIQQGLHNAQNAIIADEVYEIDSYTDEISDTDLNEANRLDDDNPYIYLIQNADFRFVNNLYFQIRYSNDYISGGMNVRTVYPDDAADVPKYVAYKANGQIMKFFYQNSDEGIFIDNVGPIKGEGTVVDDENGQAQKGDIERSGFKLTNYNARGIYDILLVSTGFDVATGTQNFDMYINRHKNNFIKLFYGNPGVFDYPVKVGGTDENVKFVAHKLPNEVSDDETYQVRDGENSRLVWNGQTYLGEYLSTNTIGTGYGAKGSDGIETSIGETSFIDSIKQTLGVKPGNDTIYPIIDAVTNKTIAYYNAGVGRLFTAYGSTSGLNDDSLDLFTTMKNYVLYIPIKSSS